MNLFSEIEKLVIKNRRVNKKALPALFFFTNRHQFADIFEIIKSFPKSSVAIIVREYDLPYEERLEFVLKIKKIALEKDLLVLVGKDLKLALEAEIDGLHISDRNVISQKNLCRKNPNFIITKSCHSEIEVIKAGNSGFDAIFFSPIFTTKTHPNQKPAGVLALSKIALKSKIPLYALGGIGPCNLRRLRNCKISGIAGISIFSNLDNE